MTMSGYGSSNGWAITVCAKCGQPIKQVDLRGTEFFQHVSKQNALTWFHEDRRFNFTHQAVPK